MRNLLVIGMLVLVTPAWSQGIQIGPGGVQVNPYPQHNRYRHRYDDRERQCQQLRYRCRHKGEMGEEGMGNCRRYQEICG